jgi:hypothetical protein
MNIDKHPLLKRMYELSGEVEKLPASEQETKVVTMLWDIAHEIEAYIDTRPLSRPAAQKNANNSNMEFMAEEYDDGVGGGSELPFDSAFAIARNVITRAEDEYGLNHKNKPYDPHKTKKAILIDHVAKLLQLYSAPSPLLLLDEEKILEVFENLGTHILHYHDKEGRTTEEQVIHKARWREIAKAIVAKFGRPALEPLDEAALTLRLCELNIQYKHDWMKISKEICHRFGTRPAHKCDKPECETCNGNGAGEFGTRPVVTICECSNEGPKTVKVHHSCPRCGGKIEYSRDNISEITGNPGKTEAILKEWLNFSEDVRPSDAAGTDWLDDLTAKTERILKELEAK